MLAIDTNIVVRILADDDRAQSAKARSLIAQEDVFVSSTVILETAWVLRSVYGYRDAEIAMALAAFAGLSRVTLEDPDALAQAIDWVGEGVEFADALHLAKARDQDGFVTFDKPLVKAAARIGALKVRQP